MIYTIARYVSFLLFYFAWLIFCVIQHGRRKQLFGFCCFANPSKATNRTNYVQCVFQNPSFFFHSNFSSGELIGIGIDFLSRKVYCLTVLNLRMECTNNEISCSYWRYENRALICKLFVGCSIWTRPRKTAFLWIEIFCNFKMN